MNRPVTTAAAKAVSTCPTALVGLFEHRLTSEASPMVSLAMTIPAGAKFSANERDCGQVAAAYKHAILQVTNGETRIALARKADLRPSPISATLSPDSLTLHSSFHINYLPEIVSTFKSLFPGKESLGFGEFEVENEVKPGVLLDGQLATQNSQLNLLEAARRVAFRTNGLYFRNRSDLKGSAVTPGSLDQFHQQTLQRAQEGSSQLFSFLLSVNNSNLIDQSTFNDLIKSCNIPVSKNNIKCDGNVIDNNSVKFNEGQSVRIEEATSEFEEVLLAFPVLNGGFAQSNSEIPSILEAFLKRSTNNQNITAITTSDTSLLGVYYKNSSKEHLEKEIMQLRSIPDKATDSDLSWAVQRSQINNALAMDSRESRLLALAQRFAFTGQLNSPTKNESEGVDKVRQALREALKSVKPVMIARGNYKKLPYYNELF